MEIKTFIANYKAAFGENTELPIVFWYSDTLENQTEKINGCFFKDMRKVREGHTVSLKPMLSDVAAVNSIQVLPICRNVYRLLFL